MRSAATPLAATRPPPVLDGPVAAPGPAAVPVPPPAPARPPAVVVQGLVKRYGDRTAVAGLDLTVPAGSVTAVLGPNGAGKTTTIECCEGFRRPDDGTVRVLGLDPVRDRRALSARIGVSLQSGGAWGSVRADELLRYVSRLYRDPLDVGALSDRLGLGSCGRTPYRRLSGGQQQRLALATAVVGRPEVVFLDEPTTGLDPAARHAVWEVVADLRRSGVTVVLCTHLMDEAEQLADLVAVIDAGRVVALDSPAALTRSGAENTIRFGGPPGLPVAALAEALPEQTTVAEVAPGRYLVTGTVTPGSLATVAAWCAAHGVLPDGLSVERATLEDVFFNLTGRGVR